MNGTRTLSALLFLVAVALVGGCSIDRAPTSAGPTLPASQAANYGTPAEEEALNSWEEREKARVALEQERSEAAYDSLKIEWERLNKAYPNGNPQLLYCDPLQYTAQVKIVGPEGADIGFGPHKLSIPPGALLRPVVITAEAPVSLSVRAEFSPHGTRFLVRPKLTLSYKHCNRPTNFRKRVAYVDEYDTILELPPSRDYAAYRYVDAWLQHFSAFAVAY